ncbi:Putative inhibitor of MCP methylation, CheC-like [Magnetospirillum sp. XM-1]|uniref:chemotaxis protein CheC n=1 Tax=Magnetospirillum sp. XM-1 TaxID=1663591 RepID=UPI00073DCC33|nr:chemotaxis protein CheC [Magnetospirillum sp. XM-1]CUW37509.1 Putative inhibitor of MCP methylation, CheC-like [Magnetospirillum sp. XM-1]
MTEIIGALERDAVEEILNVAIGQAAASLSRMVRDQISLSVPFVEFLSPATAGERLDGTTGGADSVAVRQHFSSSFSGDILLIFPERRSLDLVRSMLGDTVSMDSLTELEQEALLEVGNVILNACLGSLANQLGLAIESSLPIYLRGRGAQILATKHPDTELVMFLQVDFSLAAKGVKGYLAFVMDIVSARQFSDAVSAYVSRVIGG